MRLQAQEHNKQGDTLVKLQYVLAFIIASAANFAFAAESKQTSNTSTVNVSDVQKKDEQVKDIDEEITNARMRATLGSKSKWSFKSALSYSGGSMEKPFDQIRPNYRASATSEALTGISGTVGVNYRMNERNNLSFGTGITVVNPFHGDLTRDKFEDPRFDNGQLKQRVDIATPYLGWSRGYKALGSQMISSATYSHFTAEDATEMFQAIGNVSFSQTVLADLGKSNWQGGVSLSVDTTLYKGEMENRYYQKGYQQDDYGFGLFPFAEYNFTDKYSFRTVFGYFQYAHYKANDFKAERTVRLTPYQSMGIGISVTRDIYLYPNIQFVPEDARPERTNVALSTNINL